MLKIPGYSKPVMFNYAYRRDLKKLWMVSDRPTTTIERGNLLSVPLMTGELAGRESRAIVSFESKKKAEAYAPAFHLFEMDADNAILMATMSRVPLLVVLDQGEHETGTSELVHFIK
jgi:hypothetical protein